MRVLLTGSEGYVGTVMGPMFEAAGHDVVGFDTGFFATCGFGTQPTTHTTPGDMREFPHGLLDGIDAVVHLAALSNDPLGDLHADTTYEINHRASVRLAELARDAGVPRFLFASSCSLYGVAGDAVLDEGADFNPITPYGESKVLVERDVSALATDDFSPVFLRNATAYGVSPRLRADVVVNNLVGHAFTTGAVLIQSDGTPWRPLVHVEDFSRAFLAALEAPREAIHNEAFNVGRTEENYRISDVADVVEACVSGSKVTYAEGGGPDPRSYRVNCDKLAERLPAYRPEWTVERGVEQLRDAFAAAGLTREEFLGSRYFRIKQIRSLQADGRLDGTLRWTSASRPSEVTS